MRMILRIVRPLVLTALTLSSFPVSTLAQEVSIPDAGLNAAIRAALQKPSGPLTQQDLLSLTGLSAGGRQISSVEGLEAARNLKILDLDSNSLTNFAIASALTNLNILDLFNNRLTNFVLPVSSTNLTILDIGFNSLAQCSLPGGLTNLDTLFLEGNTLTNFNLPAGLTALTQIDLSGNGLTSFNFPADATNLATILIFANQLTNVTLPQSLNRLGGLDLDFNHLRNLTLPAGMSNLGTLVARNNQLTNVTIHADMTNLTFLDLGGNQLPNLTLPAGLTRLNFLRLSENKLTSFTLPLGLTNLAAVFLRSNQLTSLTLSPDLVNLVQLDLLGNQLTNLTLPPDATKLSTLVLDGNPLTTLVLSEPLAAGNLTALVASLPNQGVSVFTYPLALALLKPHQTFDNAFAFTLVGPPGLYTVLSSTNLAAWDVLGAATNEIGSLLFTDPDAGLSQRKFYRALSQSPPTNMVFIRPAGFTMGSPAGEQDRDPNEGPQTTVTLSRGFWIGKYEVTQAEYLAIMNTNPSVFPGDLSRPVSSVSWLDATNYCAKLTQRELAAGRIPAGSRYRLPTEAEWEYAARGGTSTRFSYGDDPGYTSLTDYAWYSANGGPTAHPVGQKIPNPYGLHDMEGNVWEWCQDWFGPLPGGFQTDPTGPESSPTEQKVMRGGAYDFFGSDCRSARRNSFGISPFFTDSDLGFRVVLGSSPE